MINVESFVTPFIESQFPSFYREEGADFILFVETYYEWLQSNNQATSELRKLTSYRDIDNTIDDFITHFKQKYLFDLPFNVIADKRLFIKHVQDLYRTKGTERGVQLLLRLIYNVNANLYYPGEDVFKLSDSKWTTPRYIEVTPQRDNLRFLAQVVLGATSGATAYVERIVTKRVAGKFVDVFFLSAITGNFAYNERIVINSNPIVDGAPQMIGSLTSLVITNGGQQFGVGDILTLTSGSGRQGKALVTDVTTETGRVSFSIIDGGFGYSTNAQVIISTKNLTITGTTNSNTSITGFQRFETLKQPLATIQYTSASNSALWANGSIVENYHANGLPSANALILSNAITNSTAGTLTLLPISGNVASDSTISVQGNTATAIISSFTNSTATANVMFVSNTSLGVFSITGSFVSFPGNYVYGLTSNTYANVFSTSTGFGATFSVGRITNDETVVVFPDLLRSNNTGNIAFMSILLDGSNSNVAANGYGFVKYPAGTTGTILQNILRQSTKTIGEISVLTAINPGETYNDEPYVLVFEPEVAALEKHDVTLKIGSVTGLFVEDEIVEMSSNSTGQQLTVSSFSGTAANGSATSTAEIGEYIWQNNGVSNTASGFVYQINIAGGAGTLKISNTTGTFVNTYGINTLTTNATATVSLSSAVTLVITTLGSVKSSNTSILKVKRLNLNNEFYAGYTVLGKSSGSTALIIDAAEDVATLSLGENANISSNVQVANTVVSQLQVLDSGFGYVEDETITLTKANSAYQVTARAVLTNQGVGEGYFETQRSFLDSVEKIHDGSYYQDYSYEVQSRIPLGQYADILKSVVHTAGTEFFGKVVVDSAPDFESSNIIETVDRAIDLTVIAGNGSFTYGEVINQGSANGTLSTANGIIIIANNQPYIEQFTQISTPSFSTNSSSANVIAVTSNSTHSTLYTKLIEGTIDTSNTFQAIIGRTLTINNIQQGNTVTGSYAVGEVLYQANAMGGTHTANGTVFAANNTQAQIRLVSGSWNSNTTAYGVSSNAYANVVSVANTNASYVATTSINTLHITNVSSNFVVSSLVTGANSGAIANVSYISITLDT